MHVYGSGPNAGKVVVSGYSNNDFVLARYSSTGVLDTSFDGDGKVTTDFGGNNYGYALAVQADGKLVVAGESNSNAIAVARYNDNGSLDTSFDGDGKVTTSLGGVVLGRALTIQDGKLLVAGSTNVGGSYDFALTRYNSDGSLDTTFDTDGKVTVDFNGNPDVAYAVRVQSDGKIVVAGSGSATDGVTDFALARFGPGEQAPSPVPGLTTWGLIALAVLLGLGFVYQSRRKARTTA